jgi:hypothetical protein
MPCPKNTNIAFRKFIFHSKNIQSLTLCFAVICIIANSGFCQASLQANEKVIAHLTKFRATYATGMTDKHPDMANGERWLAEDLQADRDV